MTTLARTALVVVGNYYGGPIGGLAGSLIGNALFPEKVPTQKGPKIGDDPFTSSAYGQMIPQIWGTIPVAGNIIDAGGYQRKKKKRTEGGKGGGPEQEVETSIETKSYAVLLCKGEVDKIVQIFVNEELIYDARPGGTKTQPKWLQWTLYTGTDTQEPDPTFEAIHGVGNVPAYRGVAYVVFKDFRFSRYGTTALNFRFVVTKAGTVTNPSTTFEIGSGKCDDLQYNPWFGLIISSVQQSRTASTVPIAVAIEPLTETVVWQALGVDVLEYYDHVWVEFCALPRYTSEGFPEQQPMEVVAIQGREYDLVQTKKRALQFLWADSGISIGSVSIDDSESRPPIFSAWSDDAVFYWVTISGATQALYRYQIQTTQLIKTGIKVNIPSGYEFTGNGITIGMKQGSRLEGDEAYICLLLENSTTGIYAVCLAEDMAPPLGGSSYSLNWTTVQELPAASGQPDYAIWDTTNQCFWIGETGTSSNPRFHKLSKQGVLSSVIDWNTEFSISGTLGNGTVPTLKRILHWDENTSSIWCVVDGVAYQWNTIDTTVAPIAYGSGSVIGSPIYRHSETASFWQGSNTDEIYATYFGKVAAAGETLEDVCDDIAAQTDLTSGQYDFSAFSGITVDGFKVTQLSPKRDVMEVLRKTYLFDVPTYDGVLTGVLRSALTSSATLDEDDIGAHPAGQKPVVPIPKRRSAEVTLPVEYAVEFIDADQNYESGYQADRRLASGGGTTIQAQLPVVISNDEAAQIASVSLHAAHIEAESYRLKVMPDQWTNVQPAKVITVSYDSDTYSMRILESSMEDGGIVDVQAVRHDQSIYTNFSVGGSPIDHSRTVQGFTQSFPVLLDIPMLRNIDNEPGLYVAAYAYAPGWTGAEIYVSNNGQNYNAAQLLLEEPDVGIAVTSLGDHTHSIDWSTLNVRMLEGSLSSIDHDTLQTDSETNYAAYGVHGRWEIVRFITATQAADGTYNVTGFYRGLLGTEQNKSTHAASDKFVVLDSGALRRLPIEQSEISTTKYVRAVTAGTSLSEASTTTIVPSGVAITPWAPTSLNASQSGGDWTLSCNRRDRLLAAPLQQPVMSEDSESYSWQILNLADEVVNTYTSTSDTLTYTSAQQTTDFGAAIDFIKFQVAQVSAVSSIGAGPYKSMGAGRIQKIDDLITGRGTLIDYWPLDDTTGSTAVAENGNDGTYITCTLNQTSITFDGEPCIKFGAFGYIDVPYWAGVTSTVAAEFVLKIGSLPGSGETILMKHITTLIGWQIEVQSTGALRWRAKQGGSFVSTISTDSGVIEEGSVHHVACNFDNTSGDNVEIFVDGVSVASGTVASSWTYATTVNLQFIGDGETFRCKTAIYDTQLTDAEVYNSAISALGP